MPLDPAVAMLLQHMASLNAPPPQQQGVDGVRAGLDRFEALQLPKQQVGGVVDAAYGPEPGQQLRVYTPAGAEAAKHLPVVLFIHGGGFVGGDLDVVDEPARALCNDTGALVVSVTYRRAPEHRFPTATLDVDAALRWSIEHAQEYGGDPGVVAVCGDSAGGNLAGGLAIRARDAGLRLAAQVLIYPMISPIADTASRREFAEGYMIDAPTLAWYGSLYADAHDALDPRLSLDRTPDLSGLPPTLILSNEYDPLRDEAEAYGEALRKAGVPVDVVRFPGLVHIVYWMSAAIPRANEQRAAVAAFLRDHLR